MTAAYTERTAEILASLAESTNTAKEIAKSLGCNVGTVSVTLKRLYRYGQVHREKIKDGMVVLNKKKGIERSKVVYFYTITEKGKKRLAYIKKRKVG